MNLNNLLPGLAFIFLLLLMLLYWLQAAFFGKERYRSLNNFMSLLSLTSLTLLLTLRWIESRHFPLSNLYESLLFLSWCFLSLKILFTFDTKNTTNGFTGGDAKGESPKLSKRDTYMQTFALQPFDMALPKFSYLPYLSYLSDLSLRGDARDAMHVRAFVTSGEGGDAKRKRGDARDAEPLEEIKVEQDSSLGLGVVLSPLALLTFGFAFLSLPKEMQKATTLVPALQSNWLMMHVTVMLLSYAALLSGSVLSIVFLILSSLEDTKNRWAQDFAKGITSSSPEVMPKANPSPEVTKKVMPSAKGEVSAPAPNPISNRKDPPVSNRKEARRMNTASSLTDKLDNYSYRVLALGFPLLTIGILSGAVWANEAWGSYWSWDPKETWALITWLVFAIYLHMRITRGWSGKKSAVVASAGFFVVWFCYLGVNLLGSGLHSYGWFSK